MRPTDRTHVFIRTAPAVAVLVIVSLTRAGRAATDRLPENLAKRATITADSVYNKDYLPKLVADGVVPAAEGKEDVGHAWCVNGKTHRGGATLTFTWAEPVRIAEIVYYARTGWFINEGWKDCEVCANGRGAPIATGRLAKRHGPQRIRLPKPVQARKLTLRFTSSYDGLNPGASEVQIFPAIPSDRALTRFLRRADPSNSLGRMPWVDRVDAAKLRGLILRLKATHGPDYAQAGEHLARLDRLAKGRLSAKAPDRCGTAAPGRERETLPAEGGWATQAKPAPPDLDHALADLQREVLLFDVDRLVVIKRHEIVASHVYTYHYEGFKPGGALMTIAPHGSDDDPAAGDPRELVTSPTGQILDCDLSYDGKTILFSWRRTKDEGYHLWTIDVDGSNLRQITDGEWHDYNGCWLPDGGIAFLSTRSAQFAYCWHAPVGVVHRMDGDGRNVVRLSANYLNDFTPQVLDDGRLIYSRWEYVDKPAIPIQSLWTINPDGTCLSAYFGNGVLSPGTFMEARSIPGTNRIICTMTGHKGPTRGAIGVVDRSLGLNAQEAIRNITPDVPLPPVDKGNGNTSGSKQYSCPVPLDAERFLVSIRGPLLVRTIDGGCQSIALPSPDGGMQYLNALPIRPRPRPPVMASAHGGPEAGPTPATVYLQDIYQGLEPAVRRGQVKRLRIVREMEKAVRIDPSLRAFGFQFPVISCGATYAGKHVLGEVPVEADGSVTFHVPAGQPVYFMALDAQGRAVQRMRSFTHFMPGEAQGCVGCHESRRTSPSLRRGLAMERPPRTIEPPEWRGPDADPKRGFGYTQIVQPVLDTYCVSCHHAPDAPKGVDLSGDKTDYFSVSYEVLARDNQGPAGSPYVSWIPTYNGHEQNILETRPLAWGSPKSRLAEIILSGHPDADGKPRFAMDETSRRRILAWIDLNVPYYASSETAYPKAQGCRRIYPANLDKTLAAVARRRCASCHAKGKIPRKVWTRITNPELNSFLLAPLAKAAGGTERCGKPVFVSKIDSDYQTILRTFDDVREMLRKRPRMDMPGGQPAPEVCRIRK